MDTSSQVAGLIFAALARARREAVRQELEIHGFEDLELAALPYLLDGADTSPGWEEMERLYRVCRVVDARMLNGFDEEERELLDAYFRRMLRNIKGDSVLLA